MIRECSTVAAAAIDMMSAAALDGMAMAVRCDWVAMKVGDTMTGNRTAGCASAMAATAAVMGGREGGTVVKAAECSSASAIAMTSGVTMTSGSATGGAGATCAMEGGTVAKAAECSSASAIADTTTAAAAEAECRGTSTAVTAV